MKKLILLSLLFISACTTPPPAPVMQPDKIYVIQQDIESCTADPKTTWCKAACTKDPSWVWCTK